MSSIIFREKNKNIHFICTYLYNFNYNYNLYYLPRLFLIFKPIVDIFKLKNKNTK